MPPEPPSNSLYHDNTGRDDVLSGGIRMIPITTPKGTFKVWTRRVGNNPEMKVLLLHGGPGFTHEYLEVFDSYFPGAGIEYYYYDQLGSIQRSARDPRYGIPTVSSMRWSSARALKLGPDNFYLYGQSWGGILAIEYALRHQDQLKGLVISNMMSSIPAYNEYAKTVLMPKMDPAVLAEVLAFEARKDFENPRYAELLMANFYTQHVLRMPLEQWPDPVNRTFAKLNREVYVPMQGPAR
jgi:proline iminopeptidase